MVLSSDIGVQNQKSLSRHSTYVTMTTEAMTTSTATMIAAVLMVPR